jgi:oligopeptide transport system ATP-binding protein
MRQRVLIACAIAAKPSLLIADEPTTALDVTVQAQILSLLKDLKLETGMAMILISHDFGVIAQYCDEVAVMYGGCIVEYGTVMDVFEKPQHPYTKALLRSIPKLSGYTDRELFPIQGQPPDLGTLTSGCPFAPRCDRSQAACSDVDMKLAEIYTNHSSACPF